MVIRDIELEMMNPKISKQYIGRKTREKTAFRPIMLPLSTAIESKYSKEL